MRKITIIISSFILLTCIVFLLFPTFKIIFQITDYKNFKPGFFYENVSGYTNISNKIYENTGRYCGINYANKLNTFRECNFNIESLELDKLGVVSIESHSGCVFIGVDYSIRVIGGKDGGFLIKTNNGNKSCIKPAFNIDKSFNDDWYFATYKN